MSRISRPVKLLPVDLQRSINAMRAANVRLRSCVRRGGRPYLAAAIPGLSNAKEKPMGSRFCLVAMMLLSLSAVSCAPREPTPVDFYNGQFQAMKPGAWSIRTDLNDEADLQMGNLFSEAYCLVLTEPKTDFDAGAQLSEFSELGRQTLAQSLTDIRENGPETLELNGQPAIRFVITAKSDGEDVKFWHVSIDSPNHFHQVIIWSLTSRFASNQRDFEQVVNSIRAKGG
jgi:hypothetical protein